MPPRSSIGKRIVRRPASYEEEPDTDDEEPAAIKGEAIGALKTLFYDDAPSSHAELQLEDGEDDEMIGHDDEVDELEDDDEDYGFDGPSTGSVPRTGLKIKLNVGAAKLRAGQTVESTPSEGTPSQGTLTAFIPTSKSKRTTKKRIIQEASEDEPEEEEEEEEEEEDFEGDTLPAAPAPPTRMTARQAALAGGGGTVEHVALEEPPNPRKRKWTEAELAQRREEAARKRKLKGAQKQEDEKQMIINRLINKGNNRRGRWATKQDKAKEAEAAAAAAAQPANADGAGEEGEDGVATGAAGEGTEAGEESTGEESSAPVATLAPTRGGWRGRGRRGRGARLPPPPVKQHIPMYRWVSAVRSVVVGGPDEPVPIEDAMANTSLVDDAEKKDAMDATSAPNKSTVRETMIAFSVPPELMPIAASQGPPQPRIIPPCAVQGCSELRKYRLVGAKDPEVGACSGPHLNALQHLVTAK